MDLELQLGRLDVLSLAAIDPASPIKIRTPDFVALARSTDFSIGYQAAESFVTVREGEVALEPGNKLVKKGETHTIQRKDTTEELPREKLAVKQKDSAPAIESEPSPANLPKTSEEQPVKSKPESEKSSSEGETSVHMIAPPADAWTAKWREADAAYTERDFERAIALATDIVNNAGMRGEVPLAKEMLCNLYIATDRPDRAVTACTALLAGATEEDARAVHYKLATIHRKELGDCRTAIAHYTQAIVFGRASPFDDEALTWRARCEIEIGDLAAARSDIAALERRAAGLARPDELLDLKKRLSQAKP
jgi:hypothetical protein